MIKRAPRAPSHRTRLPGTFSPAAPALTWVATIVATKARLTFTIPPVVTGIPTLITCGAPGAPVAPTAITQVSSLVYDLTYAAAVVATQVLIVPAGVPQIRGAAGGFIAPGTFTFP